MSKRFNLREFQQGLSERLQAQSQVGAQAATLGVQVGEEFWLVEMGDISEVLPVPPMTAVPLTKPWYCGVANVRGNLYSIVDLPAFMGHPEVAREGRSRVLLVAQKFAINAGLLVNRVLGLRNTGAWQRRDVNGKVQYEDENGQIWQQLNLSELVTLPEFLFVGS